LLLEKEVAESVVSPRNRPELHLKQLVKDNTACGLFMSVQAVG
jgi:hypothetical protein